LDTPDISGSIVTSGAMICRKKIAKKICGGEADYVIALKNNQPRLLKDILYCFMHIGLAQQSTKDNRKTPINQLFSDLAHSFCCYIVYPAE